MQGTGRISYFLFWSTQGVLRVWVCKWFSAVGVSVAWAEFQGCKVINMNPVTAELGTVTHSSLVLLWFKSAALHWDFHQHDLNQLTGWVMNVTFVHSKVSKQEGTQAQKSE